MRLNKGIPLACLLSLALALVASGCATDATGKKKSPLNYLNGDYVNVTDAVTGTPMHMGIKPITTKVSGQIVLGADIAPTPYKHQRLQLVRGDKVLLETTSGDDGAFLFSGTLSDGSYSVRLLSDRFEASVPVEIKGREAKDLLLVATEKK